MPWNARGVPFVPCVNPPFAQAIETAALANGESRAGLLDTWLHGYKMAEKLSNRTPDFAA